MTSVSQLLVPNRTNFQSYGINPLTLTFANPDDEGSYRELLIRTTTTHVRVSILLAIFIILAHFPLDYFVFTGFNSLLYAYCMRLLMVVLLGFFIWSTFRQFYTTYAQEIGLCITCIITLMSMSRLCMDLSLPGWLAFSFRTDDAIAVYYFPGVIMFCCYIFFFFNLLFRTAVLAGSFIIIVYLFVIWSVVSEISTGIVTTVSLVIILQLLAMAAYQKELISRQLYVTERREREALARQLQQDARYLEWLRRLARFLRHEVRQPVAQITSGLELIQLVSDNDERLVPHISNAALGAQHVWNLVERASRATDAEAFVRSGHARQFDLCNLATECIDGFRQTFTGLRFDRYFAETPILVTADPSLIKEALTNLVSNAASYALEDSVVKIRVLSVSMR